MAIVVTTVVSSNSLDSFSKPELVDIEIEIFANALSRFQTDMGRYPMTEEGLGALIANPGSPLWAGPYLRWEKIPPDPWGVPMIYQSLEEEGGCRMVSLGADGRPGGEGSDTDIGSRVTPDTTYKEDKPGL